MEPILEFSAIFDDDEYIINVQTKSDSINITIELEKKSLYWYKTLDSKTLSDITSQMGSYKSLKVFSDMLIQALSKKNDSLSLNFCSLNEIQQLSGNNDFQVNNENNIKKYLMMIYTSFEKVVYPIQMEYLGTNANKDLLLRTINRLKNKINKLETLSQNNTNNNSFNSIESNFPVNYNEFERLKKENLNLINKINEMQKNNLSQNNNSDIYKKYVDLSSEYSNYKKTMDNKMKLLINSLEDLKQSEIQNQSLNYSNNTSNNKNNNVIKELEKQLSLTNDMLLDERKQNSKIIEDKNREIDYLKKELKSSKETEKTYKVKISKLEKELEQEKKETAYYKNNSSTVKKRRTKSYLSEDNISCNDSYMSGFSKKTTTSYLKKNLIPNAYKNSFQRAKNYSPFGGKKKSRSKSRSGSKKSSGSNSIVAKSIKGPKTIYQRSYKSPYRYEPNKNNSKDKKNKGVPKKKASPAKNMGNKKSVYEKIENKKSNVLDDNKSVETLGIGDNNNSNNIADRLSRIQALISQASGK